ncbi:MAG TPA: cupredoxin family copper-binding protein [Candidatus Paceibacterota bacterium]
MNTKSGLSTVVIVIVLALAIVAAVLIANKVILAPSSATSEEAASKVEAPVSNPNPIPEPAKPTAHTVNISGFAFASASLQIKKGDSVIWVNQDSAPHTATAVASTFDTGTLSNGQSSAAVKFSSAGTYSYICAFHPSMKGTITVTE